MKKLIYLLLLLPMSLFTSCDKDNLASFDMTLTMGSVTEYDGTFYAVANENLTIESLTVNPVGGKNTILANVAFFIDGIPLTGGYPWEVLTPYTFSTATLAPGVHTIGITGDILQEDQSINNFAVTVPLVLVSGPEDLPSEAPDLGSYSHTISFTN